MRAERKHRCDLVILTTRDLIGAAPQPAYLAQALAHRGLRVVLISRAPHWLCQDLSNGGVQTISTAVPLRYVGQILTLGTSLPYLLQCQVAISFELAVLNAVAVATPARRFARVLYSLETFDKDWVRQERLGERLGYRALRSFVPPDVLVDVCPERLENSRRECGNSPTCFVVRNTPPRDAWNVAPPQPRRGTVRLVYAGDVVKHGRPGLELFLEGMARTKNGCELTIYPVPASSRQTELLTALISKYNLLSRVHIGPMLGRDQLPAALASHDVGVVFYPVRPDQPVNNVLAAPNKLSEYLAAGLAVLTTSNRTLQFVSTEAIGWNLAEDEPDAVARLLHSFEGSGREQVDERRRRAHTAFLERYHFEYQAAPLLDWIQQAVRGSSLPRNSTGQS